MVTLPRHGAGVPAFPSLAGEEAPTPPPSFPSPQAGTSVPLPASAPHALFCLLLPHTFQNKQPLPHVFFLDPVPKPYYPCPLHLGREAVTPTCRPCLPDPCPFLPSSPGVPLHTPPASLPVAFYPWDYCLDTPSARPAHSFPLCLPISNMLKTLCVPLPYPSLPPHSNLPMCVDLLP